MKTVGRDEIPPILLAHIRQDFIPPYRIAMPKKDPVVDGLAKLAALRGVEDRAALADGLAPLLNDRTGYVVTRVANLAAERGVREVVPNLIARLEKFIRDPKSNDSGCEASLAIVRALIALEAGYEAEAVAVAATRYVRWEPVYGGSVDSAVSVRGNAAILLAAMGSTQAVRCAVELLATGDSAGPREAANWPARADAARALTMVGSDAAAAVLRFKLLIDDSDSNVLADCLTGLLSIERDAAIPLAVEMLTGDESARAEAALLALGGWRDARSFTLLHDHADRFLTSGSRDLFLAAIAMTRQAAAIDYLLDLIPQAAPKLRDAVVAALEPLRPLPGIADRIDAAVKEAK